MWWGGEGEWGGRVSGVGWGGRVSGVGWGGWVGFSGVG